MGQSGSVFNCYLSRVKALLEVEVRSILPVQDAAEIATAGSVLSQSDCRTPRLLLSVALLTRTRINATGKRLHENFSFGSCEGVGEEEQSLAVRFSSSRGSVGV